MSYLDTGFNDMNSNKIKKKEVINKIDEMIESQIKLNNKTCGFGWLNNGITEKGREIDWSLCMVMEAAEAIDSFNWKHWKDINSKNDYENIQMEIVDIFHFLISEYVSNKGMEYFSPYLAEIFVTEYFSSTERFSLSEKPNVLNTKECIAVFMDFIQLVLSYRKGDTDFKEVVYNFTNLMRYSLLSFDELYRIYSMKNVLNSFRNDHGYEDGTYQKDWNGVEDNVVAMDIAKEDIPVKEFYDRLLDEYKKISLNIETN